jgi:hypothetical protein
MWRSNQRRAALPPDAFRPISPTVLTCDPPRALRRVLAACILALAAAACTRPASREECELLIRKTAELELQRQNVTDPAQIEKRTAELVAARGDKLLDKCVGRRIHDRAIACIQKATSEQEIDACLD